VDLVTHGCVKPPLFDIVLLTFLIPSLIEEKEDNAIQLGVKRRKIEWAPYKVV
jgi:hypothetical protein